MRHALLVIIALPLAACGIYPTPDAISVSGLQPRDATPAPDVFATRAAINAAAEYAIAQTVTAQAVIQATQAAEQTAVSVAETARWSGVVAQQTQTALTATAQFIAAQQATGTQQAGIATATASAAAPVATATYVAQQARDAADAQAGLVWLGVGAFFVVALGVGLGFGLRRLLASLGVEREKRAEGQLEKDKAEAEKIRSQAVPQVLGKQPPALGQPGWIVVFVQGQPKTFELPALGPIIDAAAPRSPAPLVDVTRPANMTDAQDDMIAFVSDAIATAVWNEKSQFIPTDSAMGRGGADWDSHIRGLESLGLVKTKKGRPPSGATSGTYLCHTEYQTLGDLLAALKDGLIIVSPVAAKAP